MQQSVINKPLGWKRVTEGQRCPLAAEVPGAADCGSQHDDHQRNSMRWEEVRRFL